MIPAPGSPPYRGRFAPTPSGPLHLGSLMTALASFLEARAQRGAWLLRIDDLDGPRCRPGVDALILRQLEQHGLAWDEAVRYQSAHQAEYAAALAALERRGLVYPCSCTRAEMLRSARPGPDGPVYPGTCRAGARAGAPQALRLRVPTGRSCFDDTALGTLCRELTQDVGDFVVRRADGIVGYQLACVVDEQAQGITHVMRGADLVGSTFRQLCLQQALGLPRPVYRHLPVLVDRAGRKLSKQNLADAIDPARAPANLLRCLERLGQSPPPTLQGAAPAGIVEWALAHWRPQAVPSAATLEVE